MQTTHTDRFLPFTAYQYDGAFGWELRGQNHYDLTTASNDGRRDAEAGLPMLDRVAWAIRAGVYDRYVTDDGDTADTLYAAYMMGYDEA